MKKFDRNNKKRFSRRDSGRSDRRGSRGSGRGNFNRRDSGRGYGRGRSNRREPLEMHQTVCDACKQECEVPFKPTASKPIYCSDCFKKNSGSKGNNSGEYEKEFVQINKKLDKILKALKSD